jgi:hypothetical protein
MIRKVCNITPLLPFKDPRFEVSNLGVAKVFNRNHPTAMDCCENGNESCCSTVCPGLSQIEQHLKPGLNFTTSR